MSLPLADLRQRYENELFNRVLPFWERHSPDRDFGGYFNCLDRDGSVYDTSKHLWLQGRQVWMFSKLYTSVEQRPEWLEMARVGANFLRTHGRNANGRVYFALSREGQPQQLQRKIFSECFYIMAMAEYSRASGDASAMKEAREVFEQVWTWAYDWSHVGKPSFSGNEPSQMLAVPMILLNLIEELAGDGWREFATEIDTCIAKMLLHVHSDVKHVFEHVAPDGTRLSGPTGRLLNPGHAIEAGWFLQHWAQRLKRPELAATARDMVRWSYATGWDAQHGGLFYFLDAEGYSPIPLEWPMKLWWPHCEALYAHLLNFHLFGEMRDAEAFLETDAYTFSHFPDAEYGEWYGYLDREGRPTHRFKGGPYKGCFHVPRALFLCWTLLKKMEAATGPAAPPLPA